MFGFPSVSGLALFPEIFSPPYPSGQRRTRATPVQRWFYKAARCWEMSGPLREGKQKLKGPKVMSPRSCPGSDGSLSSILLGADGAHRGGRALLGTDHCSAQLEASTSACTALSPSDHHSSLGAPGKQELRTAQRWSRLAPHPVPRVTCTCSGRSGGTQFQQPFSPQAWGASLSPWPSRSPVQPLSGSRAKKMGEGCL